jgi:DNA mismatch repair ATPase MutL
MEKFSEEQQKQINEMIANAVKQAIQKPEEKPAEAKAEQKSNSSINEEAKNQLENEKQAENALAQMESSIAFNMSVKNFVEKQKSLLPAESINIVNTAETKTFKNQNEKANVIRKSLLDSYLEKKENIEPLTDSMKAKAELYKSLAESDKERRSSEFWDLIETGTILKDAELRKKERNIANGLTAQGSSGNILEDRILAKAKEKFNFK